MSSADINNSKRVSGNKSGFTLIELLIVISIIGLLSGILLVSMQGMREKARNARRLSDMSAIVKAIQLYYDKYGYFPPPSSGECCSGWDQGPCAASSNPFLNALRTAGFLGAVPNDPGGKPADQPDNGCYGYGYYVFNAGTNGCDANRGKYFVIGISDMEGSSSVYPGSPGFSCGTDAGDRNFQDDFEWVRGGFERDL